MKKLNNKGDVEAVIPVVLVGIVAFFAWQYVSSKHKEQVFKQWSYACQQEGGDIQQTYPEWWECVVDGKIKVLSGYEQYQADKPSAAPNALTPTNKE